MLKWAKWHKLFEIKRLWQKTSILPFCETRKQSQSGFVSDFAGINPGSSAASPRQVFCELWKVSNEIEFLIAR